MFRFTRFRTEISSINVNFNGINFKPCSSIEDFDAVCATISEQLELLQKTCPNVAVNISASGTLKGNPMREQTFSSLDDFKFFLRSHDLRASLIPRMHF